jgi:hypothetical protein
MDIKENQKAKELFLSPNNENIMSPDQFFSPIENISINSKQNRTDSNLRGSKKE